MAKQSAKPFGIGTKRFAGIGYHPSLDPSGAMRENKSKLGPGEYYPQQLVKQYKYKDNGSVWDKQKKSEEFSNNLGFRNAHVLKTRRFLKSLGGPGTYDISEEVFARKSSNRGVDSGFGKQPKFYSTIKSFQPPPGTYGKDISTQSIVTHKQLTPIPMFEWDGFLSRFKDTTKPWSLAPNRYDANDRGSIEELLQKVVSRRGPYDLFTGPRDNSTIKNHFSRPKSGGPDKFYNFSDTYQIRCGKFLKATRFPTHPTNRMMLNDLSMCYKDPKAPGPATYHIQTNRIDSLIPNKYPFNESELEVRKGMKWLIMPGPGRYTVKPIKCMKKRKESWVFKSKTKREFIKVENYTIF